MKKEGPSGASFFLSNRNLYNHVLSPCIADLHLDEESKWKSQSKK
jgi:hypothetical protein